MENHFRDIPNPAPNNDMIPPPMSGRLAPAPAPTVQVVSTKAADLSTGRKFKVATFLTLAFVLLSHPQAYKIMNYIITLRGDPILNEFGQPTWFGIILHTVIFFIVALILLYK